MTSSMKKIWRIVGLLLIIHILISLFFIIQPEVASDSWFAKGYKRYLLPGPFFVEDRIKHSHLLFISWKLDAKWSAPANPTLDHYRNFFNKVNPSLSYRSSLERDMYEKTLLKVEQTQLSEIPDFEKLKVYIKEKYVPPYADSVKLHLVRSARADFKTTIDTLRTIVF